LPRKGRKTFPERPDKNGLRFVELISQRSSAVVSTQVEPRCRNRKPAVEEQATTTKTNWRVLARAQTVYENRSALTGAGPTAGAGFGIQTTAIATRVHAAVAGSPESPQGGSSELKRMRCSH